MSGWKKKSISMVASRTEEPEKTLASDLEQSKTLIKPFAHKTWCRIPGKDMSKDMLNPNTAAAVL